MRLAPVLAQGVQHRRQGTADRSCERQRHQRVGGVVTPTNAQCIHRHEPLDVQNQVFIPAPFDGFVRFARAHQPGHAIDGFNPVVSGAGGLVGAEGDVVAQLLALDQRRQGGHHEGIMAIEQHESAAEDAQLRGRIGRQCAVPVEMILRHIENGRHGRLEAAAGVELKARQLQHPNLGQCATVLLRIKLVRKGVEQGRADVARHRHGPACAEHQLACQRSHRGLAVGAGHADHLGHVALRRLQVSQRLRKEVEFTGAGHPASCSCRRQTGHRSR